MRHMIHSKQTLYIYPPIGDKYIGITDRVVYLYEGHRFVYYRTKRYYTFPYPSSLGYKDGYCIRLGTEIGVEKLGIFDEQLSERIEQALSHIFQFKHPLNITSLYQCLHNVLHYDIDMARLEKYMCDEYGWTGDFIARPIYTERKVNNG